MPQRSVREAVFDFRHEIQNVSVELTQTEDQLDDISVRLIVEECIRGKECEWAIHERRDALHADRESVSAGKVKHTTKSNRLVKIENKFGFFRNA